jgi:ACS family hexuronate transporter-like MFS transporter
MKPLRGVRWQMVGLLFAATTINYIDRNVLSFTMLDEDFRRQMLGLAPGAPLDQPQTDAFKVQMGYVDSIFKLAYALGFLLMGWLVDRLETRRGFAIGILVWASAAVGHAWAGSVAGLGAARALLGLGEAANFPAAIKTVAEWFPRSERSLATGLFNSGANIGIIVTALAVPWLTFHLGWRAAFLATGALGFLLLAAWWAFYRPPHAHPRLGAAERAHLGVGQPADDEPTPAIGWWGLLRYRQTWAFVVGKFMADPIWWFYLTWLPDFFNSHEDLDQKLDLRTIGLPFLAIYLVSDLGSVFFGWLSAHWLGRGWALGRARKATLLVCACCVLPIGLAAHTHSLYVAVGLIALATAAHTGWAAIMYTFAADLFPRPVVAKVTGLGGMAGALGGVLLAAGAGLVRVHYGYWPLFALASGSYLTGLLIIHRLLPTFKKVEL